MCTPGPWHVAMHSAQWACMASAASPFQMHCLRLTSEFTDHTVSARLQSAHLPLLRASCQLLVKCCRVWLTQ